MKMIEQFGPQPRFHVRDEFIGEINAGGSVISDLHTIVQYAKAEPGKINACIKCDEDLVSRLDDLLKAHPGPWILRAVDHDIQKDARTFFSNKVWLEKIETTRYAQQGYRAVARFALEDYRSKYFVTTKERARRLTFYLAGPEPWLVYEIGGQSYTGEVKNEVHETPISLGPDSPFSLGVRPHYFYDRDAQDKRIMLTTRTMSVIIEPAEEYSDSTDEQFVDSSTSLANDLMLLASFIACERVDWFGYSLIWEGGLTHYLREGRSTFPDSAERRPDSEEIPFQKHHLNKFYASAIGELRRLRVNKIDITSAMHFFVDGCNRSRLLEEQFAMLFLCLEHLKDLLSDKLGLTSILDNTESGRVTQAIQAVLEERLQDTEAKKHIIQKLPELNRYPLKHCLSTIFRAYGVDYDDLYPPKARDMAFVNTRNDLFHTSKTIDRTALAKETERLRAILQRLILKLLGWEDLHLCPSPIRKAWLAS